MDPFVNLVQSPARVTLSYGLALLKGVTAEAFRRVPDGVSMVSPAFVYGHLSIYPNRVLAMWEMSDRATMDAATVERYGALFGAGVGVVDDPEGRIYPSMEEIVSAWQRGHGALIGAMAEVPASVLERANPNEAMRERFPTIGSASAFMLIGHPMLHFGQVSAWRRIMGLGPCM